ncbi:MAG: hypothetical protein M1825_000542 [Sarcosagium campestre]|nr:MAG: hypothetical protein M1825_000542 [Sarcosagium campestre]
MVDISASLQLEYCPPIDVPLFIAIISDYDLSAEQDLLKARRVLDSLKQTAWDEDATAFDASGSSGYVSTPLGRCLHEAQDEASVAAESTSGSRIEEGSVSHVTDLSSLSQNLSAVDLNDEFSPESVQGEDLALESEPLESMSTLDKISMLRDMFPGIDDVTVERTLEENSNSFHNAFEIMLNQVFVDSEIKSGNIKKGIDGFVTFDEKENGRGSKRRRKGRKPPSTIRLTGSQPYELVDATNRQNNSRWSSVADDIDFLSSRTGLDRSTVSSSYHRNGASISATLLDLVTATDGDTHTTIMKSSVLRSRLSALCAQYPTISREDLAKIVYLGRSLESHAYDLAKTLMPGPEPQQPPKIEIVARLPPINLQGSEATASDRSPSARLAVSHSQAVALSNSHDRARQTAFGQASAAYRKGKSDHLMAAAAGYYSSIGHEHDRLAKGYSAAAADELVAQQSTASELDLHGVTVKDATRIALERVTSWWVNRGDERVQSASRSHRGFTIITGSGKHSEGGKGKLGPAVAKMLVREGWKFDKGEGIIVVTGIAKPR